MKIFTVSPLPLGRDSWTRDITVIYRGFEQMGHVASAVRLHSNDGADFPGVLQISMNEMTSPHWWEEQKCDLVVANTWGQAKYNALVRAIKASGAKVVVRLDSDGHNSPWSGFTRYAAHSARVFRERDPLPIAIIKALIKTAVYAVPQVYDLKMIEHLSLADVVGIESETARKVFARLLYRYGRRDLIPQVKLISHPVVPEIDQLSIPPISERKDHIIAVGRWDSIFKDTPLLIKTLALSLLSKPSWTAQIYGKGESVLHELIAKFAAPVKHRIHVFGPRPHNEILAAYQKAKICLFSSYSESGPIAGEEALCLGCTLVGPPEISSMQTLCAPDFGSLPMNRSPHQMAIALSAEIEKWDTGLRCPSSSAQGARQMFSAKQVCRKILGAVFASSEHFSN